MEKAIWNEHYTTVFCEICKHEVDANNRPLGCLNRRGYKNLGEKFFAQTGKKLTKKQFKNKWDLLKKEYTQFMELKNAATGLGWDYVRGTIEADEVWWKVHLEVCSIILFLHHNACFSADLYSTFQKYPKHAKYKKKGLTCIFCNG
jgi:hypothetical protein